MIKSSEQIRYEMKLEIERQTAFKIQEIHNKFRKGKLTKIETLIQLGYLSGEAAMVFRLAHNI